MPTIEVSLEELSDLVGVRLSVSELEELLLRTKASLEEVEGEMVVLEVTADRLDLLSVEGLSRAIKGLLGVETGAPRYEVRSSGVVLTVDRSVGPVRPYIMGAVVKGVRLSPGAIASLMQAQEKLHATIGRDRRRVAIGIHDFSKVEPPLVYRAEPAREVTFVPLHEERAMTAEEILRSTEKGVRYRHLLGDGSVVPVIRDRRGEVLSMPPIINSDLTKVTEESRGLFIDMTGTDLRSISLCMKILCADLAERGGRIESVRVIYPEFELESPDMSPQVVEADLSFIESIVGEEIGEDEVISLLRAGRIDARLEGERVIATVPAYRHDFLHPVDLAEEVAVLLGYHRLEPVMPVNVMTVGKAHPIERLSRKVRVIMVGLGYQEVANYIMTSEEVLFYTLGNGPRDVVRVGNPVSASYEVLRDTLLPGLIWFIARNPGAPLPHKVFEVGDVVIPDPEAETLARDERRIGAAISDVEVGFEDIQSHLFALGRQLGLEFELEKREAPGFLRGRCAGVRLEGEEVGIVGEISPEVLEKVKIRNPVAVFEISLTRLGEKLGWL